MGNHYEIYPDPLGNYDRLFTRYGPMIKTVNMGTTIYHTNDPEISRHVLREGDLFTKTTSDPSHPLFYMNDQTALFTCDSASPAFALSHKFVPPAMSPRAMAHHAPPNLSASTLHLPRPRRAGDSRPGLQRLPVHVQDGWAGDLARCGGAGPGSL